MSAPVNAVQCNTCKAIIHSKHQHDFQTCDCGAVSVDGGNAYRRMCYEKGADWTEIANQQELDMLLLAQKQPKKGTTHVESD